MESFNYTHGCHVLWKANRFEQRKLPHPERTETQAFLRVTAACGDAEFAV